MEASLEGRLAPFRADAAPDIAAYRSLFTYFVEGWTRHRSALGALATYPGWASWSGARSDALEGFARIFPLFGAWVSGGRSPIVELGDGSEIDLADVFYRGVLAGTDPASPEYWGGMRERDQRIVEAADVALSLWLFRDLVWVRLDNAERERVATWLRQVETRAVYDNNWHLFVVVVSAVLQQLGCGGMERAARKHYERIRRFHRDDGWFSDGEPGKFDYYNAWSFHYSLYWLNRIDPDWDPGFSPRALAAFLDSYRYLVGPKGFPILGRSVCYRMAAPIPLVLGYDLAPNLVSAGQARRALDCTWQYFIRRGALRGGNVTQGYFQPDRRIVENYSGPASCLWSLRSLISAFQFPDAGPFWTSAPEPLPVEREDYRVSVASTGWTIIGRQSDQSITVEMPSPLPPGEARLRPYRLVDRLLAMLLRTPQRPDNFGAKYGRTAYSSARPFCADAGSLRRRLTSLRRPRAPQ